jgi:hypothetical protein
VHLAPISNRLINSAASCIWNDVSETGLSPSSGKRPTLLGPISGARDQLYPLGPIEQNFNLRTKTEISLRNVVSNTNKNDRQCPKRRSLYFPGIYTVIPYLFQPDSYITFIHRYHQRLRESWANFLFPSFPTVQHPAACDSVASRFLESGLRYLEFVEWILER